LVTKYCLNSQSISKDIFFKNVNFIRMYQ
jgi:hypothetical protein